MHWIPHHHRWEENGCVQARAQRTPYRHCEIEFVMKRMSSSFSTMKGECERARGKRAKSSCSITHPDEQTIEHVDICKETNFFEMIADEWNTLMFEFEQLKETNDRRKRVDGQELRIRVCTGTFQSGKKKFIGKHQQLIDAICRNLIQRDKDQRTVDKTRCTSHSSELM